LRCGAFPDPLFRHSSNPDWGGYDKVRETALHSEKGD
jgi:hypothetical protein